MRQAHTLPLDRIYFLNPAVCIRTYRFSMEAHAVHWNRKYRTFDECLKHEDGLCILAYLFLVSRPADCQCYVARALPNVRWFRYTILFFIIIIMLYLIEN